MSKVKPALPWLLAITILVMLVANLLRHPEPNTETIYIPQEVISERIIQTETIAVPKDELAALIQEALGDSFEEVLEHVRSLDMEIAALSTVTAQGSGETVTHTVIVEGPQGPEIVPVEEDLHINFGDDLDPVEVPVAHVSLTSEGELNAHTNDVDLSLRSLITETEQNSLSLISWLTLEVDGVSYEVPVSGTTQYQLRPIDKPDRRWHFDIFDPSLDLNLDLLLSTNMFSPGASLGASLSSLNRGDTELWRFVRASIGFTGDHSGYWSFAPVMYNIGAQLPVFDDLWIAPIMGSNTDNTWFLGISLGTTL